MSENRNGWKPGATGGKGGGPLMAASRRCPAPGCRHVSHGLDLVAAYEAVAYHLLREHGGKA